MIKKPSIECVNIGIDIFQVAPPPKKLKHVIPDKLLLILKKYPFNWRLSQLAKPKWRETKFIPKIVKPLRSKKKELPKLPASTKFYSDQISRPLVRTLVVNKGLFGPHNGRKYVRLMNKYIAKAWASIYNFYTKKERDKKKRQLLREAKLTKKDTKSVDSERIGKLAKPKPIFTPPPIKKSVMVLTDFDYIDTLATPRTREEPKLRDQTVSPAALTYEPTETIIRLAAVPERFRNIPPPTQPGVVSKAALRFKITPRLEEMAIPKQRKEKAKEDEEFDPWAISKNALKYKATPRILELAKPLERE